MSLPRPFETTSVQSSGFFPATLSAFIIAAVTTIAVPCWSSWNTGMSSSLMRVRSISTHLGAEMSSRFIPPNVGAICLQNSIIFLGSFVSMQSGTASTPANFLKRTHFPSITGSPAAGPMSPSPRTAVPSETTAIVFPFHVYLYTSSAFLWIALHGSATPGVYAADKSSLVSSGIFSSVLIFPRHSSCFSRAFS